MKKLLNFKQYLISLFILFILTIIYTLLLYFNLLKTTSISYTIITLLLGILTFFLISFIITNKTQKKGWLKGLLIGVVLSIILLIIRSFETIKITFPIIIKYCCFIFSSMLASIINVNKNKEK